MHAVVAGKEQRRATEAAADVEHAVARTDVELGGDVPFLGLLSLLQRYALGGEVGAGVLHVLVEEAAVEIGRVVVVVVDVAPRPAGQVDHGREPGRLVQPPLHVAGAPLGGELLVEQQEIDEVRKLPFLDGERAVHVGPAHVQGGMDGEAPVEGRIVHAHRGAGTGAGNAEIVAPPGVVDHTQVAAPHEAAKK